MCILLGKTDHPDYSLILISNRDECFERDTEATKLRFNDEIICGLDKLNGGTWLGVNVVKRTFAVVLNVQSPHILPNSKSRGILPLKYLLRETIDPANPLSTFAQFKEFYPDITHTRYFSLVYGSLTDSTITPSIISLGDDNIPRSKVISQASNFVVTNNILDEDIADWPKYERGMDELKLLNNFTGEALVAQCQKLAQISNLPDAHFENPITLEQSKKLVRRSIFIPKHRICVGEQQGTYGTRTTTIILVHRKTHNIELIEHDYTTNKTQQFAFPL